MTRHPLGGLDPVELATALSQLPPTHELVAAARAAVDIADARAADRAALADAARDASADCQGYAMQRSLTRAALVARADLDGDRGTERVARFDDATRPPTPPPAPANPDRTAAAVAMARAWADEHAAAHDARAQDLARWHDDRARDTAAVPEQSRGPVRDRGAVA